MSLIDVLGSQGRLKLLRELSREPKYVSELTEAVGMDGSTARHHLTTLEEHELVDHYSLGNRKYYYLVKEIEMTVAASPERTFILQATDNEQAANLPGVTRREQSPTRN